MPGAEAGPALFWQGLPTADDTGRLNPLTATFSAGPRAAVRLGGRVALTLEAELPVYLLRVDDQLQAVPLPSVSAGVAASF